MNLNIWLIVADKPEPSFASAIHVCGSPVGHFVPC
jgi:hypothetical protein